MVIYANVLLLLLFVIGGGSSSGCILETDTPAVCESFHRDCTELFVDPNTNTHTKSDRNMLFFLCPG